MASNARTFLTDSQNNSAIESEAARGITAGNLSRSAGYAACVGPEADRSLF